MSHGIHFLTDKRVVHAMLRSARPAAGDLIVEFGPGQGALTAPLSRTGARILAIERDPAFVRRLERRFAGQVRVVHADLRDVPLPRRPYAVVANVPFAVSTALVRRLLHPTSPMTGADLLVEWGFAVRLARSCPRTAEEAGWAASYAIRVAARVPAASFSPAPRVDAAHLVIRRTTTLSRPVRDLIRRGFAEPRLPIAAAVGEIHPRRRAHRLLTSTGIDPPTPISTLTAPQWNRLATALTVNS
ncbi:16S rRNA (adenine(1518)-N(6)/adenine(1519)-N(6)) -dimethyltransferase RsmA [Fodinicola feengrottensis]|uniref:16S rRNA (Adenine(1518)-N(6)/adenine(1519)-N(6)) -dimethyltransferase RsmA n=1 Tax=Fodinicola feengrottensis TaxID=435914 RepID=A0ABN2IRX8_9ACTN